MYGKKKKAKKKAPGPTGGGGGETDRDRGRGTGIMIILWQQLFRCGEQLYPLKGMKPEPGQEPLSMLP